MSRRKRNSTSGVITIHTPFPVSLLRSEECTANVKDTTESRKSMPQQSERTRGTCESVRPEKRNEASPCGPKWGTKQNCLSYTSLRQLQAKLEAKNQQVQEIIKPLHDRENGFMKELEFFLTQHDVTELRRRELLHKHWTEHVWFPLQQRVKEHVSSFRPVEAKRRQSLYSHYLHHCNTKGFVFLETYDLKEYDPFLLNIKMEQCLKDPLRLKGKRTHSSLESGDKYTQTKIEQLTKSHQPFSESVTSQANKCLQASSTCPVSASFNRPVVVETAQTKSSRFNTVPLYISATTTLDGRCHQTNCWFSRC